VFPDKNAAVLQSQLTTCDTAKFLPLLYSPDHTPMQLLSLSRMRTWLKSSQVKGSADFQVVPEIVLQEVGYGGFQKYLEQLDEPGVD
jgi:hypothetical protein